jgi:hypothetical protein
MNVVFMTSSSRRFQSSNKRIRCSSVRPRRQFTSSKSIPLIRNSSAKLSDLSSRQIEFSLDPAKLRILYFGTDAVCSGNKHRGPQMKDFSFLHDECFPCPRASDAQ